MIRSAFLLAFSAWAISAQTPTDTAWTILKVGVSDKSPDTRAKAITALGLLGREPKALEMAETALTDEKYQARVAAANALGQIKATASIPKLKDALNDTDGTVIIAVANALYEMNDPVAYEVFYAVLRGERKSGSSLKESQMKVLNDPKALAKMGFEQGIGFVPFAGAGYSVFKLVTKDDASPVRAAAAQKLVRDPDPKSAEGLAATITDKKWLVRAAAIDALAKRDDAAHVSDIASAMTDENDVVRYTAAAAVIRLSHKSGPATKTSKKD